MALNLNLGFFTLPDPEISQESSVDPMGLQVIWTWFGQQVFQDKLTTVANDLLFPNQPFPLELYATVSRKLLSYCLRADDACS